MVDKLSPPPKTRDAIADALASEVVAHPRRDPASIRVFPEQGVTVDQVALATKRALEVVAQAGLPSELAAALKQFDPAVMPACRDDGPLAKAASEARHQIAAQTVAKWASLPKVNTAKDPARAYLDTLVKTERAWK